VKKLVLIIMMAFTIISCKVVKLESLQKKCSENKTLILFFSKKVEQPISVKLDGIEIPIVSVFSGTRLELYNVTEGKHLIELSSNYYILNRPIRNLDIKYDENCAQQILIRNYVDKLVEEQGQNSFISRIKKKILFWKKAKGFDENSVESNSIYGKFTR